MAFRAIILAFNLIIGLTVTVHSSRVQDLLIPEFVAEIESQRHNELTSSSASIAEQALDLSLVEDSNFLLEPWLVEQIGSLVGVATLPGNLVALFHRGNVVWTPGFFDGPVFPVENRRFGPIKSNTIVIVDGITGKYVGSFGGNKFYVPHGISSDSHGNLWVTDVALHQVFRYPYQSVVSALRESAENSTTSTTLVGFNDHIQPDLTLGEPFVPGNDERHFCKPTDVAVASSGLAFISDGYCNSRILIVTPSGQLLDSFGHRERMLTPHSLSLLGRDDLICVADRDNSRILCYNAALTSADLSSSRADKRQLMFAIDYPLGRVFAIEHVGDHLLVLSINSYTNRAYAATIELASGRIIQDWTPKDWTIGSASKMPHDLSVTHASDITSASNFKRSVFVVEATPRSSSAVHPYGSMARHDDEHWATPERKLFKYIVQ